jgi:hypothetical protein
MVPAVKLELPAEWDINKSAAVVSDNPQEIYKEWDYLRSKCPVAHVDLHGGYWIMTKFVPPSKFSS